jgi:hypothetical protein
MTRLKHLANWIDKHPALIASIVLLGAFGLYALDWRYSLSDWSFSLRGGKATIGATRLLGGEIPYRDFWTMYAPGQFYVLALLFRIFGTHLLVEIIAVSAVCAVAAVTVYLLVVNLTNRRLLGIACAGIFVGSTYDTAYFKRIGSYNLAILLVLIVLNLLVLHFKTKQTKYLVAAGLVLGVTMVFKHDVGGYTAIATVIGLVAYHLVDSASRKTGVRVLISRLVTYSASATVIVLPILIYFVILAGADMLQDLVIFPLTDFRFSRPESYPSLLPIGLYDESELMMMRNLTSYVNFTVPFVLFLLGLPATVMAVLRRRPLYAALGVTLLTGFVLHYVAAHVQINTHIITMSIYASILGVIFYDLVEPSLRFKRRRLGNLLILALVGGWFLSLMAKPMYDGWLKRRYMTAELELGRVSGFRVTPEEAQVLSELSAYVDSRLPVGHNLYVGLHRHDAVIVNDIMIYFILDRPSLTRYQELHPAITDTAPIQSEMIEALEQDNAPLIVLKHMFPDDVLDEVKANFQENLPQVGATDLDNYIAQNYRRAQDFGPYSVWERD